LNAKIRQFKQSLPAVKAEPVTPQFFVTLDVNVTVVAVTPRRDVVAADPDLHRPGGSLPGRNRRTLTGSGELFRPDFRICCRRQQMFFFFVTRSWSSIYKLERLSSESFLG
jgi:hypothetical protein